MNLIVVYYTVCSIITTVMLALGFDGIRWLGKSTQDFVIGVIFSPICFIIAFAIWIPVLQDAGYLKG